MPDPLIRPLDPVADLPAVAALIKAAADYWWLVEDAAPSPSAASDYFTDCPPGCDPAASARLGLFMGAELAGIAELSFGFPEKGDAYLGLMILAPGFRGHGLGARLLAEIEGRARAVGAPTLFLGVVEVNSRGMAFWQREGFRPTSISRVMDNGKRIHRLSKPL